MKVKAIQLTDVDVHVISAVDRGAIREPFRILKRHGDQPMINLSDLKLGFKKAETRKPEVALVAFAPGFPAEKAVAILKEAGFEHGEAVTGEEGTVYPSKVVKADDKVLMYQVNDNVVIGIRHDQPELVQKGFTGYEFESTDYKTVLGTNGTMPMMHIATSALQDVVHTIMAASDTIEVAKADIDKAVNDYGAQLRQLLSNVPSTAFKLEAVVLKTDAAIAEPVGEKDDAGKTSEEKATDDKSKVEKSEDKPEADADKAKEEGKADDKSKVEKAEDKEGDKETPEADKAKEETKKSDEPSLADVMAAIKGVTETVTGLADTVKKQGDTLETVKKSADDAALAVKKMDEGLGTGLLADMEPTGGKGKVEKSEGEIDDDDEDVYLSIDTGYASPDALLRDEK